jgi:hypothetical protein
MCEFGGQQQFSKQVRANSTRQPADEIAIAMATAVTVLLLLLSAAAAECCQYLHTSFGAWRLRSH